MRKSSAESPKGENPFFQQLTKYYHFWYILELNCMYQVQISQRLSYQLKNKIVQQMAVL